MKIKPVIPASLLLIAFAYTTPAHLGPRMPDRPAVEMHTSIEPTPPVSTLPDLVVMSIKPDNLDSGEVRVAVKNRGLRKVDRTDVTLTITHGSQPPISVTRSTTPLPPGGIQIVAIEMNVSLVQAKFCATIDEANKIPESNENNNKRCGQFGGKP